MPLRICFGCMREVPRETLVCPECGCRRDTGASIPYALKPGSTLQKGKYLVGHVLGQGGFGITYIGMDGVLGIRVAIKEYYPMNLAGRSRDGSSLTWHSTLPGGDTGRDSFLKEARKMAKADDIPSIVKVRDVFYENNTAYIVMTFIEGETLKSILKQSGPMAPDMCLDLLYPVIEALGEAHRHGLIHRDISPDNIMIDHMGKSWLLDMGAAKDMEAPGEHGQRSQGVVKHGFSPPEQYTDRKRVGTWSDVYAMCATIYYAITGRMIPNAMDRVMGDRVIYPADFPPSLKTVLERGLALQPERRIQTMGELLTALRACSLRGPIPKPRRKVKLPKLFGRANGRRSFGKIPLIAALCLAVVVGGILFLKSRGEGDPDVTPTPSAAATQALVSATPSTPTPSAAATPSPDWTGRVGSIVKFGHYEQDNNTANGTEELEWIVLAEQDDSFLLLSRYVLDNRTDGSAYTDLTWEDNDNRIWLNMTFLDEAFTAEEQQKILTTTLKDSAEEKMGVWEPIRGQDCEDQIFLLSCTEVKEYLSEEDDRRCQPTAYAKSRGIYPASDGNCVWWLRTFSVYNNGNGAATIRENGKFGWVDVDTGNQCGIRPAFWIRWS